MRGLQGLGDFACEPHHLAYRELSLGSEPLVQGFALDIRHRTPQAPLSLAGIVHPEDLGVLKARRAVSISRRKRAGPLLRRGARQRFERDRPLVAKIVGAVDRGHSAA